MCTGRTFQTFPVVIAIGTIDFPGEAFLYFFHLLDFLNLRGAPQLRTVVMETCFSEKQRQDNSLPQPREFGPVCALHSFGIKIGNSLGIKVDSRL